MDAVTGGHVPLQVANETWHLTSEGQMLVVNGGGLGAGSIVDAGTSTCTVVTDGEK